MLIELNKKEWIEEFDRLKKYLLELLQGFEINIEHVGSTAIPDLIAKPILDIDIVLHNKADLKDISTKLQLVGYRNKGEQGITGRFACRQTSPFTPITVNSKKWMEHHLYLCFSDSVALKNHLLFRDALLADLNLVQQYAQLKNSLLSNSTITRENYSRKKTEFIISVLRSAGLKETELKEIENANK